MVNIFVSEFAYIEPGEKLQVPCVCELKAMSSARIALAVSGHFDIDMVDRDRVRERPLCRGQIGGQDLRVSQTIDRKGR